MSECFDLPSVASSFGLAQHDRGKKIGFRCHKWPLFHRCPAGGGLSVPVRQRSRSLALRAGVSKDHSLFCALRLGMAGRWVGNVVESRMSRLGQSPLYVFWLNTAGSG
jgi:hypothetical protein